jgi:phage gp45-like
MSYFDQDDAVATMMRRATVKSVDDTGTQQIVTWTGLKGEEGKAYRQQGHGSSSVPPVGSEGYLSALGGRSDRMLFHDGEHKDHRPKKQSPGDTVIYDAHGQAISLVKKSLRIVGADTVTIVGKTIVLEGDVYLGSKDGAKKIATEDTLDSKGGKLQAPFATKAKAK